MSILMNMTSCSPFQNPMCLRVEVSAEVVTIKGTFKWANPLLCNPTPATHPPTIIPARMTYVMSRAETITSELWGSKRSKYLWNMFGAGVGIVGPPPQAPN